MNKNRDKSTKIGQRPVLQDAQMFQFYIRLIVAIPQDAPYDRPDGKML
jgi:hypothetical protein